MPDTLAVSTACPAMATAGMVFRALSEAKVRKTLSFTTAAPGSRLLDFILTSVRRGFDVSIVKDAAAGSDAKLFSRYAKALTVELFDRMNGPE